MKEIIIESQCIATGSIKGVLNGHSYNRAMRANKLLMESLYDLLLVEYVESLPSSCPMSSLSLELVRLVQVADDNGQVNDRVQGILDGMYADFTKFVEEKSSASPTCRLWVGYIQMVSTLMTFLRAARESDWALHKKSL